MGKSLIRKLPKIKSSPKKLDTLYWNNFWPKMFDPTKNWKKLSKIRTKIPENNNKKIIFLLNFIWEYISKNRKTETEKSTYRKWNIEEYFKLLGICKNAFAPTYSENRNKIIIIFLFKKILSLKFMNKKNK